MTDLYRRQHLVRSVSALSSALGAQWFSGCATLPATATPPELTTVKPPKLKAGSTVGLIAPSGVIDQIILDRCISNLQSLGFNVRPSKNILARWGGYAGTIEQRVNDFHEMYFDNQISAIWTARGGSGCAGLLPFLQYERIRANPKILIGFSDITALHLALQARAGLVTFHGPGAGATMAPFSVAQMREALMESANERIIYLAPEQLARAPTEPEFSYRNLSDGVAQGRLVGGNLSIVASVVGTPFLPSLKNKLLFLEEVREAPYRIDRLLHQLAQNANAGLITNHATPFAGIAGAALGVFSRCNPPDSDPSLTLNEVIDHHFSNSSAPAAYGFSFGHITPQITLPLGINAKLDTNAKTITLLESAVQN
jgi:muramoyltetrapeptide carboxypeptidase